MYSVFTPSGNSSYSTRKEAMSSITSFNGAYIRFHPQATVGGPRDVVPSSPLAIPTRSIVEITADREGIYKCIVTTSRGERKILQGSGIQGVVSPSLTMLVGMYQMVKQTEDITRFICTDKMIISMYRDSEKWIKYKEEEKEQYSETIAHILSYLKERKTEITTTKPKGI